VTITRETWRSISYRSSGVQPGATGADNVLASFSLTNGNGKKSLAERPEPRPRKGEQQLGALSPAPQELI
jgi:hypothetical protein